MNTIESTIVDIYTPKFKNKLELFNICVRMRLKVNYFKL